MEKCSWMPANTIEDPMQWKERMEAMSLRHWVAASALVVGVGGAGLIAADTSLVLGSTSDAGVVTICVHPGTCPPSGPIRVGPPVTLTQP
jgi:hypothetical protein